MGRNAFNPQGDAVVAKAFRFAGVEYELGEPFLWRELGSNAGEQCALGENDLRGLWLADLIDFVDPTTARKARNEVKVAKKPKIASVTTKPASAVPAITQVAATPPAVARAPHVNMVPVEPDPEDDLYPPVVEQEATT